jgi:hypothetical protein
MLGFFRAEITSLRHQVSQLGGTYCRVMHVNLLKQSIAVQT